MRVTLRITEEVTLPRVQVFTSIPYYVSNRCVYIFALKKSNDLLRHSFIIPLLKKE